MKTCHPTLSLPLTITLWTLIMSSITSGKTNSYDMFSSGLVLQSMNLKVGILPHAGGRLVLFQAPDGPNMLREAPERWGQKLTDIQPDTPWIDYRGHIIWLSPQSQWWAQQNLDQTKRKQQSLWPPDPYLTLGQYQVIKHTPTCLVLKSPISPVSGMQLTKTYELLDDATLQMTTQASNCSDQPHQWGIWSNTRVPMDCHVYVKVNLGHTIKLEALRQQEVNFKSIPWAITQGWFHFDPIKPETEPHERWIKVGLDPNQQQIICFQAGYVLIKSAITPLATPVAQEHAPVELFLDAGSNTDQHRMEIEMHGSLTHLDPGQSMTFKEAWQLIAYPGSNDQTSQIQWLKKNVDHD
jgi:hypothetical protein